MQIVSTREFRANQKKYFELAERETVFVSRKNARPILISVADDDDLSFKEELLSITERVGGHQKRHELTECRRVRALRTS